MTLFPKFVRSRRRASALVITLALVVLMTIIAIGMFTATRMEVTASKLHLDSVRADQLAQFGQSIALARLETGLQGSNRAWVSQPGRLVTSPANAVSPMTNVVELHSGQAGATDDADVAANLNPALLQNLTNNLLFPPGEFSSSDPSMRVKWVYVRKDGAFETNLPPALDAANPVVGRFAFWVDDEATKINVNTAFLRSAATTNVPSSDPLRVNLGAVLDGIGNASNVVMFRTNSHRFNSPEDIRQVDASVAAAASTNAHLLTHYNHSPNLDMFGERKIVLTTQKSLARAIYPDLSDAELSNYFLDIFPDGTADIDPGDVSNVSLEKVGKFDALMHRIVAKLDRTDWPIAPGTSYSQKFGAGSQGDAVLLQTLSDIVEYVRCKESANEIVEPVSFNPASFFRQNKNFSHAGGNGSLGTTRAPYITEFAAWLPAAPVSVTLPNGQTRKYWPVLFKVELYLPEGAGDMDLSQVDVFATMRLPGSTVSGADVSAPIGAGPPPATPADNVGYLDSGNTVIQAGQYRTVTIWCSASKDSVPNNARPGQVTLSCQLVRRSTNTRIDEYPENRSSRGTYQVDPAVVASGDITSMSVVDPFLGKHGSDWTQGPNSFSAPTPISSTAPGSFSPQQDTDVAGTAIVTNTARIPARKGTAQNPFGMIESVAELGAVHVGMNGEYGPGVPWRTLRLQPLKQGNTDLPDWALLDLFCAPMRTNAPAGEYRFTRPNGDLGGVVNLNQEILPFVDTGGTSSLSRTNSVTALLSGARRDGTNVISSATMSNIAQSLRDKTLANSGVCRGRVFGTGAATNVLFSPGQIIEYASVADQGEAGEAMLKDILDLASARSGVFTIYSLGQSVFQDREGRMRVLAEHRQENMVEVINTSGTTSFQTVFSKKLKP